MTIEAAIQENTAAIRDLITTISRMSLPPSAPSGSGETKPAKSAPEALREIVEKQAEQKKKQAQVKEVKTEDALPLSYDVVSEAVTSLVKRAGHDAAVAVLKGFGLKTLRAAQPEQYVSIKEACEAVQ